MKLLAGRIGAVAFLSPVIFPQMPPPTRAPDKRYQESFDPRDFGAAGNGSADDTKAFAAAIVAARASGRPIRATGLFRIDGTLDPAGVSFEGLASPYTRNSLDPRTWGFVIQHNSDDGPLFALSACGVVFHNVVLHDPRQPGDGVLPKVRPPMFHVRSGQCTDFTLENSVVVNAYDLFRFDKGTVSGDWRVRGNRLYAIRYGFDVAGSIPEGLFLADNIWSPGVWQGKAVFGNGGMLAKWTGLNGAVFRIDSQDQTLDGLKSNNEAVLSYRNYLRLESGGINVSTVTGASFDQVPQPLSANGNAMVVLTISGGFTYGSVSGTRADSLPAFLINSSGVRRLTVSGHSILYATSEVMRVSGPGSGSIEWQGGQITAFGQSAPSSAAVYANAPATDFTWAPALTECTRPGQRGVAVANIRLVRILSAFSRCAVALDIGTAPAMILGMDTSLVANTVGAKSYRIVPGSRFKPDGFYDKP